MNFVVKICGLTDAGDVAAAINAGADALGFVFAESTRRVSAAHAAEISRQVPAGILRVAVMQHPDPAEWQKVADIFKPDILQTDAEDFEVLDIDNRIARWPVYREGGSDAVAVSTPRYVYEGQKSGHGQTVDWDRAARIAWQEKDARMILAGGLGPENVAEAVLAVRPGGVDASSSLENAPGRKSGQKMADFVAAAKASAADY